MTRDGEKTHESTKPMDVPSRHTDSQSGIYDRSGLGQGMGG